MKLALVMITYERPDALAAVLRSVARQTIAPDEIIIGDDGSGPETAEVVAKARKSGMAITYEWREHDGFRAARMRNCALAHVTSDYVVFIDGDLLIHPEFIRDHRAIARPGYFVQGKRALLGDKATEKALRSETYWPSLFEPDVDRRRHLLRIPFLSHIRPAVNHLRGIRSCNFAVWMDDIRRVNGFNEDFVGWGREDDEFAMRLHNAGIKRINLRCSGVGCHLNHPPHSRDRIELNSVIAQTTSDTSLIRCENGLSLHMTPEKNG